MRKQKEFTDWTTARQPRRYQTSTGEDERANGGSQGMKGSSIKKWGWNKARRIKRKNKKDKKRKTKHRRRGLGGLVRDRSEERGRKKK